jgi:hypothetical protein
LGPFEQVIVGTLNMYLELFGKQLVVAFVNHNSVEVLDLILIVKSSTSICMLVCSVRWVPVVQLLRAVKKEQLGGPHGEYL